jgi:hypothetical protein
MFCPFFQLLHPVRIACLGVDWVSCAPGFDERSVKYDVYFYGLSAFEELDDFLVDYLVEIVFSDLPSESAENASGVNWFGFFE